MPRTSLRRRLTWGFALGAFVMASLMALFMDHALRRSMEAEDALVMEASVHEVASSMVRAEAAPEPRSPRPEQVEWLWIGGTGEARRSPGFPDLGTDVVPLGISIERATGGRRFLLRRLAMSGGHLTLALDRTHEESLVREFRRTLLLAVGLSSGLAALLGRLLAARGLAPLHRLAEETATLEPASLGRRLDPARYPEELGEVVDRLNGALERMEEAFERLSGLAGELAHELRTPIQSLRAEAEALVRSGQGPPDALGSILEECDRLAAHIEQMLFLARAEDPGAVIERSPVDLAGLLEEVRAFFEGSAEEAGISLESECGEGASIKADQNLLRRGLHNLVTNALRHTPAGGTVRITAHRRDGKVIFQVVDSGAGIPEALRPNLGRRWSKGEGSRGLGLGLAIVRSIARLHGGELVITDIAGGGTRAGMELPDPFQGSSN